MKFSLDVRILAVRLGVGDLECPQVCHGFQHGCICEACAVREEQLARGPVKQPWELAA